METALHTLELEIFKGIFSRPVHKDMGGHYNLNVLKLRKTKAKSSSMEAISFMAFPLIWALL